MSENTKEESKETLGYAVLINDGSFQKYLIFFKNYEDAKKLFEEHKQGFIEANKDNEDLEPNVLIDTEKEWRCRYVNKNPDIFSRHEVNVRVAFMEIKNDSYLSLGVCI